MERRHVPRAPDACPRRTLSATVQDDSAAAHWSVARQNSFICWVLLYAEIWRICYDSLVRIIAAAATATVTFCQCVVILLQGFTRRLSVCLSVFLSVCWQLYVKTTDRKSSASRYGSRIFKNTLTLPVRVFSPIWLMSVDKLIGPSWNVITDVWLDK